MLPLLGPLILHRTVINWNRSSDVLLSLHVTGTREQPAWQLWWTTWSGRDWRLGVITMFYHMQHNMVFICPADYLYSCPNSVVTKQIRSRPDVSRAIWPDRHLKTLFSWQLYICGMHYQHRWSSLRHSPPSKQAPVITTATEPRHVTIDHQCVILDHRGLHFTGRWRWTSGISRSNWVGSVHTCGLWQKLLADVICWTVLHTAVWLFYL